MFCERVILDRAEQVFGTCTMCRSNAVEDSRPMISDKVCCKCGRGLVVAKEGDLGICMTCWACEAGYLPEVDI